MRAEDFREATWVVCPAPPVQIAQNHTVLASSGRKFKFGMPSEFLQVILRNDGKIFRVVVEVFTGQILRWERFEA